MSEENQQTDENKKISLNTNLQYFQDLINSCQKDSDLFYKIIDNIEKNKKSDMIMSQIDNIENEDIRNFLSGYLFFKNQSWIKSIEKFLCIKHKNEFINIIISEDFYRLKDYEKSLEYALKAHALNPTNLEFLFIIGNLYTEINNISKAIFYYEKIIETDSKNLQANIKLYKLYLQNKQPQKANEHINKCINIDSANEEKYVPYWITGLQYTNLQEAQSVAEKYISKYPNNGYIVALLGAIYKEKKEYSLAIKYITNAINLVKKDKNFPHKNLFGIFYENLLDIYITQEDVENSVKYSLDAINNSIVDRKKLYDIFIYKSIDTAINIIKGIIAQNNKEIYFTEKIGLLYFEKNELDLAEKYLLQAIHLKTKNIDVYLKYIAIIFREKNNISDVITEYKIKDIIKQGLELADHNKIFIKLSKSVAIMTKDKELFQYIKHQQHLNG